MDEDNKKINSSTYDIFHDLACTELSYQYRKKKRPVKRILQKNPLGVRVDLILKFIIIIDVVANKKWHSHAHKQNIPRSRVRKPSSSKNNSNNGKKSV